MAGMSKRFLIILAVSLLALAGFTFYVEDPYTLANKVLTKSSSEKPCAFCNPDVLASQTFYEGDTVSALINYKPLLKGHSLIVPKRHVERFEDLTPDELVEIGQVVQMVNQAFHRVYGTNDYVLVLQNGTRAGQTEHHVHFHMIPRGNENIVLTKARLWLAFIGEATTLRKPMTPEETTAAVTPLREAMDSVASF